MGRDEGREVNSDRSGGQRWRPEGDVAGIPRSRGRRRGTGSEAGLGDHSPPSSLIHSFNRSLLRACCVPGHLAGSGQQGGGRPGPAATAKAVYVHEAPRRQAAHSSDFFSPLTPVLTSRGVFGTSKWRIISLKNSHGPQPLGCQSLFLEAAPKAGQE